MNRLGLTIAFAAMVSGAQPAAAQAAEIDLGFAGTSAFGGPVGTPSFDRIAREGLRYNDFHTTAVCSPTRAALKSGRNHHVDNMGGIIETGTAFPGNTGQIPGRIPKLAVAVK